jgi:tRNA dimethylallyltransferase
VSAAFSDTVKAEAHSALPMTPASQILPMVVIVGPTASGKSSLGIWLAQKLAGEVAACDSTQMYRGFDIGTAKPTVEERARVPHHLLDVLDAEEMATAGGYREKAIAVLDDLRERRKLPIFTVGTGLYLRALLLGLAEVPLRSEELRERLRASAAGHGPGYLHHMLEKLDLAASKKISPSDEQKLIRAVEVCLLAKKTLSEVYESGRKPLEGWRAIKVGLQPERENLMERVNARTDSMLERAWMEEVRSLMGRPNSDQAKAFDFIGYRELREVCRGQKTLHDARTAIQQATRQYAKRQVTWFRKEPGVHWLSGFGEEAQIQDQALAFVVGSGLTL